MQGRPYVIYLAVFAESTGRASCDTLSAVDAGDLSQDLSKAGAMVVAKPRLSRADGADLFDIPANRHAAFAENTFIGIADNRGREQIQRLFNLCALIFVFVDLEGFRQCLQLTCAVANTGKAFPVMVESSSSKLSLRAFCTRGVLVFTCIPSLTGRTQAACSAALPTISTRQTRHAPMAFTPFK